MNKKQSYKTTRNVPVKLTNEELLDVSRELAKSNEDAKEIENKKAEVNAQFTAELKKAKAEIDIFSRKISSGEEYRDVECDVVIDQEKVKKKITRCDTGQIIHEQKLTNDDLQMELGIVERKRR